MNSRIVFIFVIFFVITCVKCFKSGVTRQSCTSMRPEHKRPNTNWEYAPQFTRDPPFEIRVNTTKVKPGDLVEVVLTSKGKYDFFKGYFMQVFEDKSFFSQIIPFPQGSWIPLGRSRTLKCHIYEDSISHTEASYKRNVTMLWKAPQAITHPFKVKGTVVRNFTHYWEDIFSPTIYPSEVITIVDPPVQPSTDTTADTTKAKEDLLETLAKEVGADSAKELLEILKQKVDEKNNPPTVYLATTLSPTKTADEKIKDLKDKNPQTAEKIETVAKNPGILDKVKNLFGGGDKGSGGGLFSSLLGGGGSGMMSMLPMLMPMLSGGGGPLAALMGGGKSSNPLSMLTSMMGGGGGAGGLMSSLLGGGATSQPSNPLAAIMGGGGGSSNPLASLMGGGGGGSSNPMASLLGGGGGGGNPLASLLGGGGAGGGGANPLAGLLGGGGGASGGSNPLSALMGGQPPQAPRGGGNSLNALMSNPAVTSMLKSMTGGGGPRPPPSGGAGGQNLADLLGVDPNAGTPRAELAENTSGTKARPISNNAFPQMIGNTRTQSGGFGNGMQSRFPGMQQGVNGNQFQGRNGQINRFPGQQGMFRGQQQSFGQSQFSQSQMGTQQGQMPGSFGRFPQGQSGFQSNRNQGQLRQGTGFNQPNQNQQSNQRQNKQNTVVDMNKIQSMMNGPNGAEIKNVMQEMLAGRKSAADVMALVNSYSSGQGSGGNTIPTASNGFNNAVQNGFRNGGSNGFNNGGPNGFNNGGSNGFNNGVSNGFSNGGSNPSLPNRQGGFVNQNGGINTGMTNGGNQGGFGNGMAGNSGSSFGQGQGAPSQGQSSNFNSHGNSQGGHIPPTNGVGTNTNTGPDLNINPPPTDVTSNTGNGGFIKMPDFTSMLGGSPPSSGSGSSAGGTGTGGAGGLPDLSSLLGKSGAGGSDLSGMLDNIDMSQISGMMGGMKPDDLKGMLSGPQGADLMSAASALMSGGKVDDNNPLAGILNGPQGDQIKNMAAGLMKGGGGGLAGLLGGGGGGGGLGGIMSMLG